MAKGYTKPRWQKPTERQRMDRYMESQGLLNYQIEGMGADEVRQRFANAGIRLRDFGKTGVNAIDNNAQGNAQPNFAPPPAQPQQPIQRPRQAVPFNANEPVFAQSDNGLLVRVKPHTYGTEPTIRAATAMPQPVQKFASAEDVKNGRANWTDVLIEDRKNILKDPNFYKQNKITQYSPAIQQQILTDPNFDWTQVPKWQRPFYEASSRPAVAGAVQGLVMGLGNPGGAAAGAAIGAAAAATGYDQNKEAWEQGDNKWTWDVEQLVKEPLRATFGYLNLLAEFAEKTIGTAALAANAAADPNKQVMDVFNKETFNASASFFEVIAPAIKSAEQGDGRITWGDAQKLIPALWQVGILTDLVMHPEKYKGEELYLGAAMPVELEQTWVERLDTARAEIAKGRNHREVMTEMQTGIMAQIGDMAGQGIFDPLNVMPQATSKVGRVVADATGHKIAAEAFTGTEGLREAAQKYKTLVQTDEAGKIDPNFDAGKLNFFEKKIAGLNSRGEVKAGSIAWTNKGLLDPVTKEQARGKGIVNFLKMATEEDPKSRAQTGLSMFSRNVGSLLSMFTDPKEAAGYIRRIAAGDNTAWKEMGSRIGNSPEWYTVLPALKDFSNTKLEALAKAWELTAPNRDALNRIAEVLETNSTQLLDDWAGKNTVDQDFARIIQAAKQSDNPAAKGLLKDFEAGMFKPDTLREMIDVFHGKGSLPHNETQWKYAMYSELVDHFEGWAADHLLLNESPEARNAFFQTVGILKTAQSIVLLGASPGYAIQNGLSGIVHLAASGIYGSMTPKQMGDFVTRWETPIPRLDEGVGIGGIVDASKTGAISEAGRGKGALTEIRQRLGKISRGMPMSRMSSWFESRNSTRGYVTAIRQFQSRAWRRGVGFKKMDGALVKVLTDAKIDPNAIYAAIEAGVNQREIEAALTGQYKGVQAEALIHDAAARNGITPQDAAELVNKTGIADELNAQLEGADTPDKVNRAFARAERKMQDWMDMRTGEELKGLAEHVKNLVGMEGAAAGFDVAQKASNEFYNAWFDHYDRFGDLMDGLTALDPEQAGHAIDAAYQVSDDNFRRVFGRMGANFNGIFDAWGLSGNADALKAVQAIADMNNSMKGAYDFMRETRRGLNETLRKEKRAPTYDEIGKVRQSVNAAFKKAFAEKNKAMLRMGELLGEIYKKLHGEAAGEAARLWWEDVAKFTEKVTADEQRFREEQQTARDMGASAADIADAKKKYYSETKVKLIDDLQKINDEGIARLERVIKNKGKGGAAPAQPSAPTPPPSTPPAAPKPMTPAQKGAAEAAEMRVKAEERRGAEEADRKQRVADVWSIAEGYTNRGTKYTRDIMQDRFALLAVLKKPEYGGLPDLVGLHDPRLDGETVKGILENRKAIKEKEAAVNDPPSLREIKKRKTKAPENITILDAIRSFGGLNIGKIADYAGDKRIGSQFGVFQKQKFSKGWDISDMARFLADDGYPIDLNMSDDLGGVRQTTELLRRALRGEKIYPMGHDYTMDVGKINAEELAHIEALKADEKLQAQAEADSVPFDAEAWRAGMKEAAEASDLDRMAELMGEAPEGGEFADYSSRLWDEAVTQIEQDVQAETIARAKTEADAGMKAAETRAEAVTTRTLMMEKYTELFGNEQAQTYMEMSDVIAQWYERTTGNSADEFYSRYYEDVRKSAEADVIGDLEQAYNRIEPSSRKMTQADAQNFARMLARKSEGDVRAAIREEGNKADRIAILNELYALDPEKAQNVARAERDVLFQQADTPAIEWARKKFDATSEIVNRAWVLPDGTILEAGFSHGDKTSQMISDGAIRVWLTENSGFINRDTGKGTKTLRLELEGKINRAQRYALEPYMTDKVVIDFTKDRYPVSGNGFIEANGIDEAMKYLYQSEGMGAKGAVVFDAEGIKATIHAFEAADFSTLVHENAHVFRRVMKDVAERTGNKQVIRDLATIEEWAGVKDGVWTVKNEEHFARGFEKYIATGEAPTPKLRKAFESFSRWMLSIYKTITGSAIDIKITDEVKGVFDRMLGAEPKDAARKASAEGGKQKVKQSMVDAHMNETFNYGGEVKTRYEIMKDLEAKGGTRQQIDIYMAGLEKQKPSTLFQEADQPFGTYDETVGDLNIPHASIMDEGYKTHLRPLLAAMREVAIEQVKNKPLDGVNAKRMSPEGQAMMRKYMQQVKADLAGTKNAATKWGEQQRDFAMLNYNKRYGIDRYIEAYFPYQFFYTRSFMTWASRALDKPAIFANYARIQKQQNRYERDMPERLRGKVKIPMPWLPDWMGDGLYIDPMKTLFTPLNYLRPFERMIQDSNYQQIEAERILQEWASDQSVPQSEIIEAIKTREGKTWERAFAEAQIRRESEIQNPMDFMNTMFGAAWYLTTPYKLLKGEQAGIGSTPILNTTRAIDTVTQGSWAQPIGDLIGMIGKPEEMLRQKLNIPEFGEYGDYYIDRQLANMVADGKISTQEAQMAMMERTGANFDAARERVKYELAMRVPTAAALMAGLTADNFGQGVARMAMTSPVSLFGAGLLPSGELEYRGLKQEWNEAWKKKDMGDDKAITAFFEEHPEYEAYLAKGKEPEERLRGYLVGQIWDGYMELGTTDRKSATAEFGAEFRQSFLDSETRSYEGIDIEQLAQWAQMLNRQIPNTEQTAPAIQNPAPQIDYYAPEITQVTDQFFGDRSEKFPNYFNEQTAYFNIPESDKSGRFAYLAKHPQLKEYWDWKKGWEKSYPELTPIFKNQVFKRVDTSAWPPSLVDYVEYYAYTGEKLPKGAWKALEQVWIGEGMPMGDLSAWLNSEVAPAFLYGNGGQ